MIIKTVIKHLIFEACIERFFNGIEKNLLSSYKGLEYGKVYKEVVFRGFQNGYKYKVIFYNASVFRWYESSPKYNRFDKTDCKAFFKKAIIYGNMPFQRPEKSKYKPSKDGLNFISHVYHEDNYLVKIEDLCYFKQ